MKNVIIETAQRRLPEFLRKHNLKPTRTVYIMVVNTDTFKSVFRELDIGHHHDAVQSLKNMLRFRIQTDQEVLLLLQSGQNLCFAPSSNAAVAIKGLNCYASICGLSSEMNYKFLSEIMMETNELTEEMKSKMQISAMTRSF